MIPRNAGDGADVWPELSDGGGVETRRSLLLWAAFYAYAYPAPAGFSAASVRPGAARYDASLGEFVLPYTAVRSAPDPSAEVRAFLQSTYLAAANLGNWDRERLERDDTSALPAERPARRQP
jgi:hypothetical protein